MTVATLLYALAGGALSMVGAWALATVFRMADQPERWVWAAGMGVGALLSATPFFVASSGDLRADAPAGEFRISERPPAEATFGEPGTGPVPPLLANFDVGARIPLARELWFALSVALLAAAGAVELRHRRRSGQFRRVRMHGVVAWRSRDQGPAVWGALSPRLVVPERIDELSADEQRIVLAHEVEHLRAGDPALNALASILLVLVPWNAFLWLMSRRLARAIESDCDRRTLARSRTEPRAYAELVLRIAAWQAPRAPAPLALAMGRSARELHGRLARVLEPTPPRRAGAVAGVALLAVGAAAPLLANPPATRGPDLAASASPGAVEPAGVIYRAREVPPPPVATIRERGEP